MNDMMTVLYIQVGKKPQVIRIRHMLSEMQRLVGGTISSFTPFDDGSVMIVNDNGKNEGLEFNRTVRDKKGKVIDIIAGDFFICYAPPDNSELSSPPTSLYKSTPRFLKLRRRLLISEEKCLLCRLMSSGILRFYVNSVLTNAH